MSLIELRIPDIGGHSDVTVAEVYIKVNDLIQVDDNLLMLETDKATMEVPAEVAGVVREVLVQVGSKVNEGDVVIKIEAAASNAAASPVATADAAAKPATSVAAAVPAPTAIAAPVTTVPVATAPVATAAGVASAAIDEVAFAKAYASPSIRKLARELGVDLSKVSGSGNKSRITEDDVKAFVKGVMSSQQSIPVTNGAGLDLLPWPKVDFAKFGAVERQELSRIKKISGANMARNWAMIPHVTVFDSADITQLEDFRKQLNEEYKKAGIKVTPLAFLIKAAVFALKKFPEFNASLDGDSLVYKQYYNIGFAADTPNGLTVPVIKAADTKGVLAIAQETSALAALAREGKLKPTDMQGGTFTVSSLGGLGSTAFTPIINAPEVAILGVSKSSISPVYNGSSFEPRLMLPLCLSFDHRVVDGALAARFTTFLVQVLSDLRRLAL